MLRQLQKFQDILSKN